MTEIIREKFLLEVGMEAFFFFFYYLVLLTFVKYRQVKDAGTLQSGKHFHIYSLPDTNQSSFFIFL